MHEAAIDFSIYCRRPRLSAFSGVLLTIRLLKAAPKSPPPRVYKALLRLRARGERLQEVLRDRQRLSSRTLRPLDRDFDGAWGALHARVHAFTRITVEDKSERAAELLATLFPNGLAFLAWGYEDEWLHSNTLLQRIDKEELAEQLDELADPIFLTSVRKAHAALGEGLGMGESEVEEIPGLAAVIAELAQAISDYGRLLGGIVDLEDPESVAMFKAAMAPRDLLQARRRSGSKNGGAAEGEGEGELGDEEEADELDELDSPLPPVPGDEAA